MKAQAIFETLVDAYDDQHPFGESVVRLDPHGELRVAVAETLDQRVRGMIGRKFDGFDAMLFVQPVDAVSAWHMNGVHEPLGLVLFDSDGKWLWDTAMPTQDSFTVRVDEPFRYALEVPLALYETVGWSTQRLIRESI